jgi:hypothetical protein
LGQVDFEPYFNLRWQDKHEVDCISTGDFNNDGLTDVVGIFESKNAGIDSNTLVFYFQDKSGHLNLATNSSIVLKNSGTITLKAADINNDSLIDIILKQRNELKVYEQLNGGGFSTPRTFTFKRHISYYEVEDLNSDGLTDIILGYSDSLFVLKQSISGFIKVGHKFPEYSAIGYIAIGDLNNDGRKDLAVYGNRWQSIISQLIYYQNSSGHFDRSSTYDTYVPSKQNYNTLAVGDINSDGKDDLVVSGGGNVPKSFLAYWMQPNLSSYNWATTSSLIPAFEFPQYIKIADLNCNLKNELIVLSGNAWAVSIFNQQNNVLDSNYQNFATANSFSYQRDLAIADINNDGKKDIIIAGRWDGITILKNKIEIQESDYHTFYTQYKKDTLSNQKVSTSVIFETSVLNGSAESYNFIQVDSFRVSTTYQIVKTKFDTVAYKEGTFCDRNYLDSTVVSRLKIDSIVRSIDTINYYRRVDTINAISAINVYPNPSRQLLNIAVSAPYDAQTLTFELYDGIGRIVLVGKSERQSNLRSLDISFLAAETYTLHIKNAEGIVHRQKVVKMN